MATSAAASSTASPKRAHARPAVALSQRDTKKQKVGLEKFVVTNVHLAKLSNEVQNPMHPYSDTNECSSVGEWRIMAVDRTNNRIKVVNDFLGALSVDHAAMKNELVELIVKFDEIKQQIAEFKAFTAGKEKLATLSSTVTALSRLVGSHTEQLASSLNVESRTQSMRQPLGAPSTVASSSPIIQDGAPQPPLTAPPQPSPSAMTGYGGMNNAELATMFNWKPSKT